MKNFLLAIIVFVTAAGAAQPAAAQTVRDSVCNESGGPGEGVAQLYRRPGRSSPRAGLTRDPAGNLYGTVFKNRLVRQFGGEVFEIRY
jgi:hypothetical protein